MSERNRAIRHFKIGIALMATGLVLSFSVFLSDTQIIPMVSCAFTAIGAMVAARATVQGY